jgi:hypothetical protein
MKIERIINTLNKVISAYRSNNNLSDDHSLVVLRKLDNTNFHAMKTYSIKLFYTGLIDYNSLVVIDVERTARIVTPTEKESVIEECEEKFITKLLTFISTSEDHKKIMEGTFDGV